MSKIGFVNNPQKSGIDLFAVKLEYNEGSQVVQQKRRTLAMSPPDVCECNVCGTGLIVLFSKCARL